MWINPYTLFLVLIIIKIFSFNSNLQQALSAASRATTNNCGAAEKLASKALSAPHDIAAGAGIALAKMVEYGIQGLILILVILMSVFEELVFFIINTLVGTFMCLITTAVETVANVGLDAAEEVIGFANSTITTVLEGVDSGLDSIESAINSVSSVLNSVSSIFSDDSDPIKNVTLSLGALRNISIPDSVTSKIEEIRSLVPNYDMVKNATKEVIAVPFDLIKQELNDTIMNQKIAYNSSAATLPPKDPVVEFCSVNSDTGLTGTQEFYNALADGTGFLARVFMIVVAVVALLVCVPVVYREIRHWVWLRTCAESSVEQEVLSDLYTYDETRETHVSRFIGVIQRAQSHWMARGQDFAARQFQGDAHKQVLARWWVEYVMYPPVVGALLLGLAGVAIVAIQFIIFSQVTKAYETVSAPGYFSSGSSNDGSLAIAGFDGQALMTQMEDGIDGWVDGTNLEMHRVQEDINDKLLGWVNTAAGAVNTTLSVFSNKMNQELNETFGGTIFYSGIVGVVYCTIGSKIEAIQEGAAWIYSHSSISLPNVTAAYITNATETSESSLNSSNGSLEESKLDELLDSTKDLLTSGIKFIVEFYKSSLYQELTISLVLVGAWIVVALAGGCYCVWEFHMARRRALRGSSGSGSSGIGGGVGGGEKGFGDSGGPVPRLPQWQTPSDGRAWWRTGAQSESPRDRCLSGERKVGGNCPKQEGGGTEDRQPYKGEKAFMEIGEAVAGDATRTRTKTKTIAASESQTRNSPTSPLSPVTPTTRSRRAKYAALIRGATLGGSSRLPVVVPPPMFPPPRPLRHAKVNQFTVPFNVGAQHPIVSSPIELPRVPARLVSFGRDRDSVEFPPEFRSFPYPGNTYRLAQLQQQQQLQRQRTMEEKNKKEEEKEERKRKDKMEQDTMVKDWHGVSCSENPEACAAKGSSACSCGRHAPALLATPTSNGTTSVSTKSTFTNGNQRMSEDGVVKNDEDHSGHSDSEASFQYGDETKGLQTTTVLQLGSFHHPLPQTLANNSSSSSLSTFGGVSAAHERLLSLGSRKYGMYRPPVDSPILPSPAGRGTQMGSKPKKMEENEKEGDFRQLSPPNSPEPRDVQAKAVTGSRRARVEMGGGRKSAHVSVYYS